MSAYTYDQGRPFAALEAEDFEFEEAGEAGGDIPFNEVEEMELAAELLEVTDEAELDQFLGKLLKKAGRALKSPLGRTLGGFLKGAIKKALPIAGGAVGNFFAPGIGGALGSKLAGSAGGLFGLELEGLSPEDQEFEVSRRLVRFAGAAAKKAAQTPPTASPLSAARSALLAAAQQHAPGFVRPSASVVKQQSGPGRNTTCHCGGESNGRWVRRNGRIYLLGA